MLALQSNTGIEKQRIPESTEPTLLTLSDLAVLLSRTPAGLRATLHGNSDFSNALKSARLKLGRRIYFRTDIVKQIIAEATGR